VDAAVGRPRTPKGRGRLVVERLAAEYPEIVIPLDHGSPFQLLAAVILSAQCTDERVNQTTPALFARYPDAASMATADPAEVEEIIYPTGFFRAKTKSLIGMARAVVERFDGEIPGRMEDLVTLPGVGRKTANVILGHWFGVPGVVVDTHVLRLSRLLGLTTGTDPETVERDLMAIWPRRAWSDTTMRMIYHGRQVCIARRPRCEQCLLADFCPSSLLAEGPSPASPAGRRRSRPRSVDPDESTRRPA
jgi:endonuclease-3